MKRTLTIIGLAVAGIVLAVALSVGAFALVGDSLERARHHDPGPGEPHEEPVRRSRHAHPDEPALDALGDALGDPIAERVTERRSRRQQRHRRRRRTRARRRPRRGRRRTRLRRLTVTVPAGQGPNDGSTPNVAEYGSMSDNLHRRDIWGDEPEERDASEVVGRDRRGRPRVGAQVARPPGRRSVQGRRAFHREERPADRHHDRRRRRAAGRPRVAGPARSRLAADLRRPVDPRTEYVWAQRMLRVAKEQANKAKDKVLRRKQAKADRRDGTSADGSDVS